MAQQAEEFEEITQHPLLDLIADPSGWATGLSSAELRFLNRMLCGNSYTLKGRPSDSAPPTELFDLSPAYVQAIPSKTNFVSGYRYGRDTTASVVHSPRDIIHGIEFQDPQVPYRGSGVMTLVVGEHRLYLAMTQKQLALMDNLGRPDFVVSLDPFPGPDQVKQLQQAIDAKLKGSAKGGNMLILPKSTGVTPLSFPPKDMGEIETQRYLASVIAGAFGIAESEIFLNSANLASATIGSVQTARVAVLPRLQKDAATLNEHLVTDFPDLERSRAWLAYDNPVPEDEQARSARLSLAVNKWVTVNEARQEDGYEPLEGEEFDTIQAAPPAFGMGPPGAPPPNQPDLEPDADADAEPEPEPAKAAKCQCCHPAAPEAAPAKRTDLSLKAAHAQAVAAWVKRAPTLYPEGDQNEPLDARWYRTLVAAFRRQESDILRRMDEQPFGMLGRGMRKERQSETLIRQILEAWGISDPRQWDRLFTDPTIGYVSQAVRVGALSGLGDVRAEGWQQPQSDDFYVSSEPVVSAARQRAESYTESIVGVNDTTAERLRSAIVGSLERGDGLAKMKEAVREAFNAPTESGVPISESRAATIARTETARAQNNGRIAGWRATQAVAGKGFVLAPGSCEFCEAVARKYAGKSIPIDSPFVPLGTTIIGADGGLYTNDYEDTDNPHPNCRCSSRPILITEGP